MGKLQTEELTGLVLADLTGRTVRSSGPVGQTAYALGKKTLFPLVTRLSTYPILLAKHDKGQPAFQGSKGKLGSKTHDIGLLPGHDTAPFYAVSSQKVLPMS